MRLLCREPLFKQGSGKKASGAQATTQFKKIIIKNRRNARARARVSPVFFEPFGKIHAKPQFLLKEREKCQSIILKHTAAK
jgi:hypothetical protein